MKDVTIYFIRHGETYLNKFGKMQGWADAPLTEQGIADAHKTGERLADTAFDAVYASDLGRTQRTAEIICSENRYADGLVIQPRSEWRESFFGSFDGSFSDYTYGKLAEVAGIDAKDIFKRMTIDEISETMKKADPEHASETNEEVRKRLRKGLSDVVAEAPEGGARVMVVTHGNVIRLLVAMIDPTIEVRRELKNSGVTTVQMHGDEAVVTGFNE